MNTKDYVSSEFNVISYSFDIFTGTHTYELEPINNLACPICGSVKTKKENFNERKVYDLPNADGTTNLLLIYAHRIFCFDCQKKYSPHFNIIGYRKRFTNRFYKEIQDRLREDSSYAAKVRYCNKYHIGSVTALNKMLSYTLE